jgi:deoxycytidylate deaminase
MLNQYGYKGEEIKISEDFCEFENSQYTDDKNGVFKSNEAKKMHWKILQGDKQREKNNTDILTRNTIKKISKLRKSSEKNQAFLIQQFKHMDEIILMRQTYGSNFFLLGIHVSDELRIEHLTKRKKISETEAQELMSLDARGKESHGQNTTGTFVLSDYFFKYTGSEWNFRIQLERFFDLIFKNIMITPTNDEFGMYVAFAAACRSGSISRQVGASILSEKGELVATGHNDTPCFGGGLYDCTRDEFREVGKGFDYNDIEKDQMIEDIYKDILKSFPSCEDRINKEVKEKIETTIKKQVTEFGSTVHAEMEALLSCARRSVSTRGQILYVTTFPCHNCARHIIAAGITKVVYVEPYAKSKAKTIHSDAFTLNEEESSKVLCTPFFGVSPRRYIEMFSLELGLEHLERKKQNGEKIEWSRSDAIPKNSSDTRSLEDREDSNSQ